MAVNGTVTMHGGTVEVRGACERCDGSWGVMVPSRGWHRWRSGEAALDEAFPAMTDRQWWALVEGICDACHAADLAAAEAHGDADPDAAVGDAGQRLWYSR